MSIINRIRKALASSSGFIDLQSVMVGTIISGIVAATAIVGLIGFTNMMNDDNSQTTLKTLSVGLESYYTEKDKYPATLAELADGKYIPQSYKSMAKTDLCYVPATGTTYPQAYVATVKSSTGNFYALDQDTKDSQPVTAYPDTTTCQ